MFRPAAGAKIRSSLSAASRFVRMTAVINHRISLFNFSPDIFQNTDSPGDEYPGLSAFPA